MGKLADMKQQVADLFNKVQDPEVLKPLATIQNLIGEAEKEEGEFLSKHDKLKQDYKEAIKSQVVTSQPTIGPVKPKQKTAREILVETGLDKKIQIF